MNAAVPVPDLMKALEDSLAKATVLKPTKAQANYRKAVTPRTCANCHYMNPNGTCNRLRDQPHVDRVHVCNLWKKQ